MDKRFAVFLFWAFIHIILYIAYYHFYFLEGLTSINYIEWIKTGNYGAINLPVFFFVGTFIFKILGDIGIILIPLLIWLASLTIIYITIKDYPVMPYIFGLLLFLNPAVISFVTFFSRDNLLFLFAVLMAYYYKKSWDNGTGYYLPIFIFGLLALYTKSSGLGLFLLLFGLVVYNMRHSISNFFFSVVVIPFRDNWYYSGWLVDLEKIILSILNFNGVPLWSLFSNPLFFLGMISAFITRHPLIIWIVGVSLLSGVLVHNINPFFYGSDNLLRYTYLYIPFIMICVGKGFEKLLR